MTRFCAFNLIKAEKPDGIYDNLVKGSFTHLHVTMRVFLLNLSPVIDADQSMLKTIIRLMIHIAP